MLNEHIRSLTHTPKKKKKLSMAKFTMATGNADLKLNTGQDRSGVRNRNKMGYSDHLSELAPSCVF